jgi:RHS repeat-associated protein
VSIDCAPSSTRVCGRGWDTPADARLELQPDGSVLFLDGEGTGALFDTPPLAGPVREPVDGWVLDRSSTHWTVRKKGGLTWFFPVPAARQAEMLVAAVMDACGNSVQFLHGPQGLERVVESAGRSFEVLSRGGLAQRIVLHHPDFPERRVMARFEYDEQHRLVAVHDALDHPYRFAWHADGRLARHTNRVGLSFRYEYDASGRCVHSWGDGGLYDYHLAYDPGGRWTNWRDSLGHRWSVEMDERGNPVAETDPLGGVTSYAYDAAGRTVAVVDPGGCATCHSYDEAGNLTGLTFPDGTREAAAYDGLGNLLRHTDPLGAVWRQLFDDRGVVTRRIGPIGDVWSYHHDDRGDLVAVTNPLGGSKRFVPDRYGLLSSIVDEVGEQTSLTLGPMGKPATLKRSDGTWIHYEYDRCGRLRQSRSSSGATNELTYDAEGRLILLRLPDGTGEHYEYAGLGEVASRTNTDGTTVAYSYDTEERLVSVTNERGQIYRFARDPLGRLTGTVDYFGRHTSYRHSPGRKEVIRRGPDGREMCHRFDHARRIVAIIDSEGGATRFAYSATGDLLEIENDDALVRRSFDLAGRLVEERQGDFVVRHDYDLYGNRTRRRTSCGNDVAFAYDPAHRLSGITINRKTVLRVRRAAASRRAVEWLGDGMRRVLTEDAEGRLVSEEISAAGLPLVARRYAYGPDGHLLERWDSSDGSEELAYDRRGQLTRMHGAGGASAALAYDAAGDPAWLEGRLGAHGMPADARASGYAFDEAGNLSERRCDGATMRLDWRSTGQLARVTCDTGPAVAFGYDGLCRRVHKTTEAGRIDFLWDRDKLLGERRGEGMREFVFYPNSFLPFAVIERDGEVRYFACDNVGLPHRLLSGDGKVLWAGRYGPFGGLAAETGESGLNPLRFLGQYADAETGLHYSLYRYYDPAIRSFVSPDPLGLLPSDNLYAYAPNPWNWMDPYGLACKARVEAERYAAQLRKSAEFQSTGFPTMASAVVDTSSGKVYLGRSGALPGDIHPDLRARMPASSLEEWPVNNCAEFDALNKALHDGASLDNLEMATVRVASGKAEPRCKNCKVTTQGIWAATD